MYIMVMEHRIFFMKMKMFFLYQLTNIPTIQELVQNKKKVSLTGNKETNKIYWRHTGYPGGIKSINAAKMRQSHPERMIEKAVKGMLPRNALGRAMYRKLKVYAGSDHPHGGQAPKEMDI